MTQEKGFSAIEILVALAVLAILTGGVWMWWKQGGRALPTSDSPSNLRLSPAPTITDGRATPELGGESADWKLYSNKQAGFSIKYPPSFFVDPPIFNTSGSSEFKIKSNNYHELLQGQCTVWDRGGFMHIGVGGFNFDFSGGDPLSQLIKFERKYFVSPSTKELELIIDGERAMKFIYPASGPEGACFGATTDQEVTFEKIMMVKADTPYFITLYYFSQDRDIANTFHKAISTFKFLD